MLVLYVYLVFTCISATTKCDVASGHGLIYSTSLSFVCMYISIMARFSFVYMYVCVDIYHVIRPWCRSKQEQLHTNL